MHTRSLRCFAHGHEGAWEAICVDLDIAVQGASFDDVKHSLEQAVNLYIAAAQDEQPQVRQALLSRKAPWHVVAKLWLDATMFNLFDLRSREAQASFPLACPA